MLGQGSLEETAASTESEDRGLAIRGRANSKETVSEGEEVSLASIMAALHE